MGAEISKEKIGIVKMLAAEENKKCRLIDSFIETMTHYLKHTFIKKS